VVLERAREPIRRPLYVRKFDSSLNGNAARREIVGQDGFCLRLRNEKDEREARIGPTDVAEIDDRRLTAVDVQHQACGAAAAAGQLFPQSEGLKNLQSSCLYAQRARLVCAIELLIDDAKPGAEASELAGERKPGGPSACHEDVDVIGMLSAQLVRRLSAYAGRSPSGYLESGDAASGIPDTAFR
jgi:hypothetical protein